jgi:hypothetical protein
MAHPQRRTGENDAATAAGNRSIGAPTPTSTSSYGAGIKDDGGNGSTLGGRTGSEFRETDDGYDGGIRSAGELGNVGLRGHRSSDQGPEGGDYDGDHDSHDAGGDVDERDGADSSETHARLKKTEEGDGQAGQEGQEQSSTWSETKTKVK